MMIPDLPRLAWAEVQAPSVARSLLLATFCYCFWGTVSLFRA